MALLFGTFCFSTGQVTISSLSPFAASTPPMLVNSRVTASAGPKNLFTMLLLDPHPRMHHAPLSIIDTMPRLGFHRFGRGTGAASASVLRHQPIACKGDATAEDAEAK